MTRPRSSNRSGWIVIGRLALAVVLACGALQASGVSAQVSDPPESALAALRQPPPEQTLAPNPPYDPSRRWDTLPPYPGNTRPPVGRPLPAPAKPAGIDLDATYISRTPAYLRYDVQYRDGVYPFLAPGSEDEKRWPDPGEIVTFTAHFANQGTVPSGPFSYAWLIDDVLAGTGNHTSLAAGAVGAVDFQWPWAHTLEGERLGASHTVQFVLDPGNAIGETYESNNVLEDATGAVSLMLVVTPQLYQALETPVNARWPFSAEDWLQKQIAAMNLAFADSAYPSAPNGIVERVRLDRIVVADMPPPNDLGLDGGFFMSVDDRFGNAYYHLDTDVSGALIHELSHQLGLPDLYGLDVVLETPQVLDRNGQPVQAEFTLSYRGLMSDPGIVPMIYDEYSALALNINRGYRRGYYGEFFFDVPETTEIRVLDNQGNPAPNATVKIYQRTFRPFMMGSLHGVIDNTPEITVTTDANGKATLPNRPVGTSVTTHTGHTLADNPFDDTVKVFDTIAGQVVAQYTAPNDGYAGSFNRPRGVAVDAGGNLVVADTGNARVVAVLGALPSSTPSPTPSPTATPTRTSTPMPTPTRTSTPTVTATAAWLSTPTPTATSTPTRRAQRVYLPLLTRDH